MHIGKANPSFSQGAGVQQQHGMVCIGIHKFIFCSRSKPVPLKSIKKYQSLAESGLGISSLVEELGCRPETVCQLYELLAKPQFLCSFTWC